MSQYIEFFVADDDALAAAVLVPGPGRAFTTVSGAFFDADDAIVTWENLLTGRQDPNEATAERPRAVALGGNDGSAVFALSDELVDRLARASPGRLSTIADSWWAEALRDGESVDPDTALGVVIGVAALARDALGLGHRVYCWVSC